MPLPATKRTPPITPLALLVGLWCLLLLSVSHGATPAPAPLPVQVKRADFRVSVLPQKHQLQITATLQLHSQQKTSRLKLYLPQMIQLKQIALLPPRQQQTLSHSRQLATAMITFRQPQQGSFGLKLVYQITFHSRKNYLFRAIFCRIDPDESYLLYGWYPSLRPFADPLTGRLLGGERYPYTLRLEVPAKQIGVAAGPLLRLQRLANGRMRYTYQQSAIKEAAIFFTTSRFRRIVRKPSAGSSLTFYLHPQDKGRNIPLLIKMMAQTQQLYERLWGRPVSPQQAKAGADRHWRLISFGGSGARGYPFALLLDRRQDYFDSPLEAPVDSLFTRRQVLLHEMAHTWWGNAVTGIGKGSIWLNEGLANYAALRAIGALYGAKAEAAALRRHVRYFLRGEGSGALLAPGGLSQMAGRIAYTKGALIFFELERRWGRPVVERGLRRFFQQSRGKFATIATLKQALEHATKKSLTAFFRDWVYSDALPFVQLKRWQCVPQAKGCRLQLHVANTGSIAASAIFHAVSKDGRKQVLTKLIPPGTKQTLAWASALPFVPSQVLLDPEGVMLHGLRLQALMSSANQLRQDGQSQRAALLFRRLLQLAPQHAQGLYSFGLLQQKRSKYKDALRLFLSASTAKPGPSTPAWVSLWARFRYALLLQKSGKTAKASAIFKQLLAQPYDPHGLKARIRSTTKTR